MESEFLVEHQASATKTTELETPETQKSDDESKPEMTKDDVPVAEFAEEDVPPPEEVAKFLPQVVTSGGWEKCWAEEVTPWDLGRPTPLVVHLNHTNALPMGRALVPGCGSGYEVVAMANPDRYVIGLDISENAVKKATANTSSMPNAKWFSFKNEDFFTWRPKELFDFIFDYVFFCAIEPEMRSAWAKSVDELLKPDGELITLMYPIGEHDGGPPYKVSLSDYEEVLLPLGFKALSIEDNELAIRSRKGREKLGRWKKVNNGIRSDH